MVSRRAAAYAWMVAAYGLSMAACGDRDDPLDAGAGADAEGAASDALPEGGRPKPGSWTHMGFDQRNWYFNPHETILSVENVGRLEEKWRFELAGFPPGSPLVVDDTVYVMATGGTFAIDLVTGEERWRRPDVAGTPSLAYANGSIYAHGTGAKLHRLDASDGTTVWGGMVTYDMKGCGATSSPVVAGDVVLVGHSCGGLEVGATGGAGEAKGGVEAHRIDDGTKAWTYTTTEGAEDGAMVWSTVGVDLDAGVVFATTGNNYTVLGENSDAIHAIDLASGAGLWKEQVNTGDLWSTSVAPDGPDTDFGANPIVIDGMVAAGEKASAFWALDGETGEVLWKREGLTDMVTTTHGGILMNGAFDGETFYALANTGDMGVTKLVAMGKDDGEDRWQPKTFDKTAWGAISAANGVLFVPVDDEMYVLDAATGEELNRFNVGGTVAAGAPAVAHGRVVVSSGLSYIFDRTTKNNNEVICYGLP